MGRRPWLLTCCSQLAELLKAGVTVMAKSLHQMTCVVWRQLTDRILQ